MHFEGNITTNLISTIRYSEIKTVTVIGVNNINELLSGIKYNDINILNKFANTIVDDVKTPIFPKLKARENGIELIQLTQCLNSKDQLVGIFLIGIIDLICLDETSKTYYYRK